MSTDGVRTCSGKDKSAVSSNQTGIRLFKLIVRQVRQKMTESNPRRSSSGAADLPHDRVSMEDGSGTFSASLLTKLDRMSIDDGSTSTRETLSPTSLLAGYGSDTGSTERRPDTRVRIRQKIRSRSKSDSRKSQKKKPKTILRPPPTYIHVRGLSGIPTQRVRVR